MRRKSLSLTVAMAAVLLTLTGCLTPSAEDEAREQVEREIDITTGLLSFILQSADPETDLQATLAIDFGPLLREGADPNSRTYIPGVRIDMIFLGDGETQGLRTAQVTVFSCLRFEGERGGESGVTWSSLACPEWVIDALLLQPYEQIDV